MQVPSRDDLSYMNVGRVEDSVTLGRVRMRSLPITHNKSPTRWREARPAPRAHAGCRASLQMHRCASSST